MHLHSLSLSFLASAAAAAAAESLSGQRASSMAISGIFERQLQYCKPVPDPATCAASCGLGNVQCISFPHCYNPSQGEVCCSDGTYCSAGYYCTNARCCPNGTPLAECGATITLSTIPPPTQSTTSAPVETSRSTVETTSSTVETTSSFSTSASSVAETTECTFAPSSSYSTSTLTPNNQTLIFSPTASVSITPFVSAAQKQYTCINSVALGGLCLLLIL